MKIYLRQKNELDIPSGFQAVTIPVYARADSSLQWDKAIQEADFFIQKGFKLVFDLDLGLFQHLQHPLSHQAQFSALKLSVDHLYATFVEKFEEHTFGLILVKDVLPIDARETSEYLTLLIDHIPSSFMAFALYDAQNISALQLACSTRKDFYERVTVALRSPVFSASSATWEEGFASQIYIGRTDAHEKHEEPNVGIVLPDELHELTSSFIEEKLNTLLKQKISFKIIPEGLIATEWDGIHTIFVPQKSLTDQAMRMLKGFEAAGGVLI